MGANVDNTLLVAVGLFFGASVLRPQWTITTMYSTKGLVVIVGFGAMCALEWSSGGRSLVALVTSVI